MKQKAIAKTTLKFLKDLEKNNNREWFNAHKDRYLVEEEKMRAFAVSLHEEFSKHDLIDPINPKRVLHKIYRDVRFSKNKTPYKINRSGSFRRSTNQLRGGYYFHIEPGNRSFVAGGFWGPNKEDLKRIRQEIAYDDQPLRKILKSKKFRDTFGALEGDAVKTAPQGFSKEHPAIDLIRMKQFIVRRNFKDVEVTSDNFTQEVVNTFKNMRPFFNYMSDVLTTDENGQPIV